MSSIWEILLLVLAISVTVYYYLTSTYNYWRSKGVTGPKPVLLFGNAKDIITGKYNVAMFLDTIYKNYRNEALVGIYTAREPILIVHDIDIMKDILVKDFSVFTDRGIQTAKNHDPIFQNLFFLEPEIWRPLRFKLTPTFTSSKLKAMFYLLLECADELEEHLKTIDHSCVDMRDIAGKFMTEVIGLCAFGLKGNCMSDGDSEYRKMARRFLDTGLKNTMRQKLIVQMPTLYKYIFGYFLRDKVLDNFIIKLTRNTMDYRQKNGVYRHDFVDLLMDIKKQQTIGDIGKEVVHFWKR